MSTPNTLEASSNGSLDAGMLIALGLLGAGLAIGAGTLLRTPASRSASIRFMRELGLPQIGREVAADLLLKLGASLTGHDAIGGSR